MFEGNKVTVKSSGKVVTVVAASKEYVLVKTEGGVQWTYRREELAE